MGAPSAAEPVTRVKRTLAVAVSLALLAGCASTSTRDGRAVDRRAGSTSNGRAADGLDAPAASDDVGGGGAGSAAGRSTGGRRSSGGSSGSGGGSGGGGDADPPGVTGGTVRIGVRYLDAESIQTAGQLFGLSGADIGRPKRYSEILVEHVNANGGLAGRKVEAVYHGVDAVELALNSAATEEKACRALTEDAQVFAIVAPGPTNQAFPECTVPKKVPVVNASYNYYPASVMERYGAYFYFPTSMDSDRSHRTFVDGLLDRGYFAPNHKLGVVRLNTPTHAQVMEESVKPALAARGLKVHEEATVRNSQDQEGYSSAVLRFRQAGITHVFFIESAGQLALYFTQRAEDQGYRPRYAFSSHASLLAIALNTPPAQLRNAIGVGWVPATDGYGPGGVELPARGRSCLDLIRRAGEEVATEGAIAVALWTCDTVLVLKAGLDAAPSFDAAGLAAGVRSLGDRYEPASTFATSFASGRRDGAARVRPLTYAQDCRCFRWSGPPYPAR